MAKFFSWLKPRKKKVTAEIEATEGDRDRIDALSGARQANTTRKIRKNNFGTYSKQVTQIKDNYNATSAYGPSMTKAVIDLRSAFICGGGVTIKAGVAQKWVDSFIKTNKLSGSSLVDMVELLEKEGKNLIILRKEGTGPDAPIKMYLQPWTEINYEIKTDKYRDPIKAVLLDGEKKLPKSTYSRDEFVYINIGGCLNDIDISPPRIASVLTQVENYERALYDLRENNHYFGRNTLSIETKDHKDANFVQNKIDSSDWQIGKYLVGPFKGKYITPDAGALEALRGEMALNAKIISSVTGLPVHWIGWTDLMANRATAETLDELIKFATKKERMKLIEGIDETIQKAAVKAREFGQNIPEFELEIELPNITSADLEALIKVYQPLWLDQVISKQTLQGMVPGIDPTEEEKQIAKEQKANEDKEEGEKQDIVKQFEDKLKGEDIE